MSGTNPYLHILNCRRSGYGIIRTLLFVFCWLYIPAAGYCVCADSTMPGMIKFNAADTTFNTTDTTKNINEGDDDNYEEILITLNVQRIGSTEIPAVVNGLNVFLSIKDLFDFLKIKSFPSDNTDSLAGFFINPQATYFFDKINRTISYGGRAFKTKANDLIKKGDVLYLKSDYFGDIFGLNCGFDFRSLTVNLTTKIELPAIREMQQLMMYHNMSKFRGEKKADTVFSRSFHFFHVGILDWSVMSSHLTQGKNNTSLNLGVGAILAGGELDLSLNYNSLENISLRRQFYKWRYVNNDHAALRQVMVGKLFTQSISSIYAPVNGIQLTNTPTTYRRSFGTYTLSNTTEPEWTVELYINNVLVNYTKADASGFYSFEVPLVYGNSNVKLKFYGPWGEEKTSEKFISVPFNFIPVNHFEYNVTAGVINNNGKGLYSRAVMNYGLTRRITLGGGMEYLSTVTSGSFMPFLNTSLSFGQHFLASGEYVYGVRAKGIISYRSKSNLQADFSYTKYNRVQTAVMINYIDEKKLTVSMPFRTKKITAYSRFTLNQYTLVNNKLTLFKAKYTTAEFLLSAVVSGISSNFTTFAVLGNSGNPLVYSNLALTFRLPFSVRFTPQAQFEYRQKKLSSLKAGLEKNIFKKGFLNIGYEKNFNNNFNYPNSNTNLFTVGVRYNFSFAQTFFNTAVSGKVLAVTEGARGSLVYDRKSNYLHTDNEANVGKGGVVIAPFVDINGNGIRDAEEPRAYGLNLRISGGYQQHNDKDTSIRITGLDAYNNYFIEFDKSGFENVAWQIKKSTIQVTVEPNNFILIEVPVSVAGEVSGTVLLLAKNEKHGLGRIIVNIYNSIGTLTAKVLTEADGYFSFMGLPPGNYSAEVDKTQLQKLQMDTTPVIPFTIVAKPDGDIADGLQFTLQAK